MGIIFCFVLLFYNSIGFSKLLQVNVNI
jgi:hypothetical protein